MKPIQNFKNSICFQTALEKTKNSNTYFPAHFLSLMDQIEGLTATKIRRPEDIFAATIVILQNCGHLATVKAV